MNFMLLETRLISWKSSALLTLTVITCSSFFIITLSGCNGFQMRGEVKSEPASRRTIENSGLPGEDGLTYKDKKGIKKNEETQSIP